MTLGLAVAGTTTVPLLWSEVSAPETDNVPSFTMGAVESPTEAVAPAGTVKGKVPPR